MFGDLNDVNLIGNITNDLELKSLPSGAAVLNFGLATNRRYKQNEEWKDETEFHNIVMFGQPAESIAKWARKGTRVHLNGRLKTRSWEGDGGKKNYKTEIIANRVLLLDRYEKPSGNSTKSNDTKSADNGTVNPNDLPF